MNHQDALREMSAEKYLLGELTGESREVFEEHLFECQECAVDVKSGVSFLEGARVELRAAPSAKPLLQKKISLFPRWLSPVWMAPALAACLAVVVYQSLVIVPGIRRQLVQANAPAVLNSLVLAAGASRGDGVRKVVVPQSGSFLLAVDIPSISSYSSYLCTLYSPTGTSVWKGEITAEAAKDTVQIHVPVAVTQFGENTLLVQGVRQSSGQGSQVDLLSTYKFILAVDK
jgi:hypothetical protein